MTTHPDTLFADKLNQSLTNVAPESKIFIKDLIPGKVYTVFFVANDEFTCIPKFKMNQTFEIYRELSTQIILEFRASRSIQSIQLSSPCPEVKQANFYIETKCETCPRDYIMERNYANISASFDNTAEYLVKDVFAAGGCYEVDKVSFSGDTRGKGEFQKGLQAINVEEGVILSTGDVRDCRGPNSSAKTTTKFGVGGGDADLTKLIRIIEGKTLPVHDVTILEFDFTPTRDKVTFEYVFASDEYCEYVGSGFNDVFGFFLSGPGISGPFENGAENIAQVPGSNDYVSINSINWGENKNYYNNSTPGLAALTGGCRFGEILAPAVSKQVLEYDGFTDVLTAVANVTPCETYHIKLAIADVSDEGFDSAVFLKANSFKFGDPAELSTEIPEPAFPDSNLVYESCQESFFVFKRTEDSDISRPQVVPFSISDLGTATPNIDYEPIRSPVVIPAGKDSIRVPLTVYKDTKIEGPETIIFELESACTCEGILTELTIVEPEEPLVTFDEIATCPGGTVSLSPNIIGGVGEINYEWSTNETTPVISEIINDPTTYSVTVTDECGLESMAEVTVGIEEQVATLDGDMVICNGEPRGAITVNFSGSAPYSLEYEFDGETRNISNIESSTYELPESEPGIYTAIAMSSNGCTGNGEGTAEVQISNFEITYQFSGPKCNKTQDGFINLNLDESENAYTYEWDNGLTTSRIEDLLEGDYSVVVTNDLGCESEQEFSLIRPDPLSTFIEAEGLANCYNPETGKINLAVEGGTPGYQFEWNNGVEAVQNPENLRGGIYTVKITDANGCETTAEAEVMTDLEPPVAMLQYSGLIDCNNSSITIGTEGSSRGFKYKYFWDLEDGTNANFQNPFNPEVTQGGNYSLIILNDDNGCEVTVEANIEENTTPPLIELKNPETLNCSVSSIELEATMIEALPDYTVDWGSKDGNFVSQTDILNPEVNEDGTYTLSVINNENGCITEESLQVIEDKEEPEVTVEEPADLTCDQTVVTLQTQVEMEEADYEYSWVTTDGQFLENRTILNPSVNQPGTYTLNVKNINNFCETTVQAQVLIDTISPPIDAGAKAVFTCDLVAMNLGGSIGDNRNYAIAWESQNGNILSGSNTLNPRINQAGTYSLLVKDEINGCEAIDFVIITDDVNRPKAVIETPNALNCTNESVRLDASNSSGTNTLNYRWETSIGNVVEGANTVTPMVDEPGTYLLFVVDETNGCESQEAVEVLLDTISPIVSIVAPEVFSCKSEQVQIDGSASSSGDNFVYDWSTEDGNIVSQNGVIAPYVSEPGTYSVNILNTLNGCSAASSLVINEERPTDVQLAVTQPPCFGDKGQVNFQEVVGGVGPYAYSIDDGNYFSNEAGFGYLNAGLYNVVVKDVNDCTIETQFEVIQPDELTVDLGTQVEIDLGDSTDLEAITNIPEAQIAEIIWSPAEGLSCDDCLLPTARPFQSINYSVNIVDQNGCEANSDLRLMVDQTPHIYVPNVFRPYDSQVGNDRFTIFAKDGIVNQIISLNIFNRWGETVFERKNFVPNDPNMGWDGFFDRQKMKPSVFVYMAEVEMIDGRTLQLKGDFTLTE